MNVLKRETLVLLILTSVLLLDFQRAFAAGVDLVSAKAAFKAQDYPKVVSLISPNLDVAPREAFVLLADAYSAQKNTLAAQKTLNAGLAKFKGDRELATDLAQTMIANNQHKEAKPILKEVIEQNPKYEPAYLAMAEIYENGRKNSYELRLLFEDLIKEVGEKPPYVTKLCELSTKEGLYDLAKKFCNSGLRLDPKEPRNYVNMANAFKEIGNSDKAEELYKKAADSFAKSEPTQFAYAAYLDETKSYVKSLPYWKRATEADGSSARSWAGYANAAVEIQKFAEAYDSYEKLCEVDKGAEVRIRRALTTLKGMGQKDWYDKFNALISKCELKTGSRGFL